MSAQGHTVIRRRPEAEKGAKPWFSPYTPGVAYRSGAIGEEYYDIVFHSDYQQFFRCIKSYPASETHAPSQGASTLWWEYMQGYDVAVAYMLLANNAFINNLRVKHLNGADGIFTGSLRMPFVNINNITTSSNGWQRITAATNEYAIKPESPLAAQNIFGLEPGIVVQRIILPTDSEYNGFLLSLLIPPTSVKTETKKIIIRSTQGDMYAPELYDLYGMKGFYEISTYRGGFIQLSNVGGTWYVINNKLIEPEYSY